MKEKKKSIRSSPIWVAHRGDMQRYPENTLAALRAAFAVGCNWVEFDVQLSDDGVPFLLHDESLLRTADIDGSALEQEWGKLAAIEVHEPRRFGNTFEGEKIPGLKDVVSLLEQHPSKRAFVELKRASLRRFGIDTVVRNVLGVLQPVLSRCVILSFDKEAARVARNKGAESIGWVIEKWGPNAQIEAQALVPDFLFCNYKKIPDQEGVWTGPWEWVLYDVRDVDLAESLLRRGVRFLETGTINDMIYKADS